MKHYYPSYYKKFRCIAADCPDSCCQGWDVVVDSQSERLYNSVRGELGDKLRAAIYTDSDGDRVFRLAENKKCPFWRTDRLCEIYCTLGEESLCETCARFPRLSMEYADFTEHSLAPACPEAARLITAEDNAYEDFAGITARGCEDYTAQEMELLLRYRADYVKLLESEKPLSSRLAECLDLLNETVTADSPQKDLAKLYSELEYIDDKNRVMILICASAPKLSGDEAALTRLCLYYIYRYFLPAIDGMDMIYPIKFMVFSVIVIASMADKYDISIAEAAQKYSKEIEQSYENMERLYDAFAGDPGYSADNLKKLL